MAGDGSDGDRATAPDDLARRAAIVDNLPDLVVVVDGRGQVTFAAGRLGDGVALRPDELLGRGALDVVHAEDVDDVMSSLDYGRGYDEDGVLGPFVLRYLDRDGTERTAD